VIVAELRSNVLPPIPIALSGQGQREQGTFADSMLSFVQPTLTGDVPAVGHVTIAPWGEADSGIGTMIFLAFLGLAGYGLYKLVFGGR
jgi:hypothetical protein